MIVPSKRSIFTDRESRVLQMNTNNSLKMKSVPYEIRTRDSWIKNPML